MALETPFWDLDNVQQNKNILDGEISNNHESHYVRFRDRHTFCQSKFKNSYIQMGRTIEQHSCWLDTKDQESQWAIWFSQ